MKVLNYNIWDGFVGGGKDRQERFVTFLQQIQPDVLAYQELCGFTSEKLSKLVDEYGHPYSVLLKQEGYPVGISSHMPIEIVKRKIKGFWHGYLHVRIAGIDIIVLHLSPAEGDYRMNEMRKLTHYLRDESLLEKDCILLGDFNAHSPLDKEIISGDGYVEKFTEKSKQKGRVDTEVIDGFLKTGLVDVYKHAGKPYVGSFPTKILGHNNPTPERIDYQLVSPILGEKVMDAEILVNEQTDKISDHYPLLVTYDL